MMKKLLYPIIMLAMLAIAGCTTNNGDIGFLGGYWRLDAIEVDDVDDTTYNGNITWAFQNNIIEISVLLDYHQRENYFGTWTRQGDILTLNYTHHSDLLAPGEGELGLPPAMHLKAPVEIAFKIGDNPGRTMTLTAVTPGSQTLTYRLSKIY